MISRETRFAKPSGAYDPGNEAQVLADAQNVKRQDVLASLQFRDAATAAIRTLTRRGGDATVFSRSASSMMQ